MQPHDTTPTKVCAKCGETKPATLEYYARDKKSPSGLQCYCKACNRAFYEANRERVRERMRAYRAANKERKAEYGRARYAANKERQAAIVRAWREANPEKWREIGRIYRETHQDAIKEANRSYRAAKPETSRTSVRRRRARKANAEGNHTAADIQAQYDRQKGRCYYAACGHVKLGDTYHVDHVVPLSRGGTNGPENIVLACPSCNTSKGSLLPHEWAKGGRLL